MASAIATRLAAMHATLYAKWVAFNADKTLPGGHPDQTTAGAATQQSMAWRRQIWQEMQDIERQLADMGYTLDEDGNPVSDVFEIVTEATT